MVLWNLSHSKNNTRSREEMSSQTSMKMYLTSFEDVLVLSLNLPCTD